MLKNHLFLLILLLLQGCGSSSVSKKTLLTSTVKQLEANYQIMHGHLYVQYDLARTNPTNCIFAKDFGRIINEVNHNKIFLQKFKVRASQNFSKEALNKINKIRDLLLTLHKKYEILSKVELYSIKKSLFKTNNNQYFFQELLKLDKIINSLPLMIPEYNSKITSRYGMRKHPIKKKQKFHCGIDLKGSKSTPIYSSATGIITKVGRTHSFGNFIEIKHSNKFTTKYAHLKKINAKVGDKVIRGELIGLQGNTGHTTGEHLHFEIWLDNKHVNPSDFIAHACNC